MSIQIVTYASFFFFLTEFILMMARRSKRSKTKIKKDKNSLLLSLLVITLPITLVLIYRIRVEEEILVNEFGARYLEYMKTTRKMVPGIY